VLMLCFRDCDNLSIEMSKKIETLRWFAVGTKPEKLAHAPGMDGSNSGPPTEFLSDLAHRSTRGTVPRRSRTLTKPCPGSSASPSGRPSLTVSLGIGRLRNATDWGGGFDD
jgi:hypothetical protein